MTIKDWNSFHQCDVSIFPEDSMGKDAFLERVEHEGFLALVLEGQLVGSLILALFGENAGHLGRIGVGQNHQGEGYGDLLMMYAIEWFKNHEVEQIRLYTQDHNYVAQNLYKKHGFIISGTTWHYFIPYDSLNPLNSYTCQEIQEDEIDPVGRKYPDALPVAQIRRFLSNDSFYVLTLKNENSNIVGACRFTPSFPGCFPFLLDNTESFDDFLFGLMPFSLPNYDYFRITFTDNPKLAQFCDERRYKLHHRLYKMTLILD